MTVNGGFPAPGPQGRDEPAQGWSAAPPPPGAPAPMPQAHMLTAHKPGIVPLRPLQFGDIMDGAFKAVRFNPKAMVGMSALVLAVFLVPSAALGVVATRESVTRLRGLGPGAEGFFGLASQLVQLLFTTLATAVLSGLLIYVLGQAVLGRRPDLGQTWRSTRGRLPSLLWLTFLSGLFSLLSALLLLGPGVLLLGNNDIGPGVGLMLLGFLAFIVVSLFVTTKISMAAPAIVLEGHGVSAGLRRSFTLTKGSAFWRILGITLTAGILAGVAGAILGAPFSIVGAIIRAVTGQDLESSQMTALFVSHLSALLTGSITTPFVASVTGLLYIDRRMRLEALDVVLLREAQTNPAPRI